MTLKPPFPSGIHQQWTDPIEIVNQKHNHMSLTAVIVGHCPFPASQVWTTYRLSGQNGGLGFTVTSRNRIAWLTESQKGAGKHSAQHMTCGLILKQNWIDLHWQHGGSEDQDWSPWSKDASDDVKYTLESCWSAAVTEKNYYIITYLVLLLMSSLSPTCVLQEVCRLWFFFTDHWASNQTLFKPWAEQHRYQSPIKAA